MRNLCQIFSEKRKKICTFALVLCLMWGLTPTAESISVKLRGKIALAGVLSGLAYTTYTLIKRDRRAVERLQLHLGPPERVVQFERGFDLWRVNYYREQCYIFRNNRLIKEKPLKTPLCFDGTPSDALIYLRDWEIGRLEEKREGWKYVRKERPSILPFFHSSASPPFLIDTPVLVSPKWSRLCLWHLQQAPRLVSSDHYRLADERLLDLGLSLSR